jgi:hypothetical protein
MPKRTDKNQADIVAALRAMGASVQDLHIIGRGCPDLVIGWQGTTLLAEVKSGSGTLTQDEQDWHASWRGQVCVIRTIDDAAALLAGTGGSQSPEP